MQHLTIYLEIYKFEVDYYIQTYCSAEKVAHIRKKLKKSGQEVIYYFKGFSSSYMDFVGYETCDKLIWTSGKGCPPLINDILSLM